MLNILHTMKSMRFTHQLELTQTKNHSNTKVISSMLEHLTAPSKSGLIDHHIAKLQLTQTKNQMMPIIKHPTAPSQPNLIYHHKTKNQMMSSHTDLIDIYFENSTFNNHIGVYNTWPDVNNAEKEVLFRIINACNLISVGVIVISNDGTITGMSNIRNDKFKRLQNMNLNEIPKKYISFVLSLHYDSPKTTHHLTLHTLWNPINYMSDSHHIQNFKTFDGYLSCYSNPIDEFKNSITNKPIIGYLNHTLSMPLHDVSTIFNDKSTCFYVGINWEILNPSVKSFRKNVLNLLKNLEACNLVSIYGPTKFLNVNVWKGFTSYKGEISFDGVSVIHEIKKCGICLVLSSESHIECEISSNRLFEGLAAGVPLICDNNSFIHKWFGNNVFYIDTTDPNCHVQVKEHIEFIKNNNEAVIEKLKRCREIFLVNFALHKQIGAILHKLI